ncbi:MAG: Fur family transcriptional regulator [Candidatus Woesearchaeota archaeon]
MQKIITEKGIKITSQREKILNIFLKSDKRHLSANDIRDILAKENLKIGLATIYRTLNLFVEKGILHKRNFEESGARYELTYNKESHAHLICKECGEIYEIDNFITEDIKKQIQKQNNFNCLDCSIKFYGVCSDCQQEA